MSQHPSFGSGGSMKQHRSVLKRYEKIEELDSKGRWSETNKVLGMPKVKVVKIKAKKEKAEAPKEGEEGAAGAVTPNAAKPAAGAKAK